LFLAWLLTYILVVWCRYDADDNKAHSQPQQQPAPQLTGIHDTPFPQTTGNAQARQVDQYDTSQAEVEQERDTFRNGQERRDFPQSNIAPHDGRVNVAHAEPETQGTGIKEDG
jgi:hypothetical protein